MLSDLNKPAKLLAKSFREKFSEVYRVTEGNSNPCRSFGSES